MNNLDELQQLMDNQQDSHERLMVGQEPKYRIKCPQCSGIFYASHPICTCPLCLERNLSAYEKSREGPFHPIPAPQKQDLPQGDTKTAAEEIDALKRRIKALEDECASWRNEAIGWRRRNARLINESDPCD